MAVRPDGSIPDDVEEQIDLALKRPDVVSQRLGYIAVVSDDELHVAMLKKEYTLERLAGLAQAYVKDLEWQYVDIDRMHLWIPGSKHKNGKPHSVPLNEMALSVLRKLQGRHATRVFTFRGEPIVQVSTLAWRRAARCDDRLRSRYAKCETRKTNGLTFPPSR